MEEKRKHRKCAAFFLPDGHLGGGGGVGLLAGGAGASTGTGHIIDEPISGELILLVARGVVHGLWDVIPGQSEGGVEAEVGDLDRVLHEGDITEIDLAEAQPALLLGDCGHLHLVVDEVGTLCQGILLFRDRGHTSAAAQGADGHRGWSLEALGREVILRGITGDSGGSGVTTSGGGSSDSGGGGGGTVHDTAVGVATLGGGNTDRGRGGSSDAAGAGAAHRGAALFGDGAVGGGQDSLAQLAAEVNVLAILAVLAGPTKVETAHLLGGKAGHGLTRLELLGMLDQTSGDGNVLGLDSAVAAVQGHNLDLVFGTEVGGEESHGVGGKGGGVLAGTAAGDHVGVLGTNVLDEGGFNVDLVALVTGMAAALLEKAAQRDLLLEEALEELSAALGVVGLGHGNHHQTSLAGGVEGGDGGGGRDFERLQRLHARNSDGARSRGGGGSRGGGMGVVGLAVTGSVVVGVVGVSVAAGNTAGLVVVAAGVGSVVGGESGGSVHSCSERVVCLTNRNWLVFNKVQKL